MMSMLHPIISPQLIKLNCFSFLQTYILMHSAIIGASLCRSLAFCALKPANVLCGAPGGVYFEKHVDIERSDAK
jgi:hypothetical protein